MANIFPIDFEEKLTMANGDFILFSDSEDGNKIKKAQYSNLKWEQGDPWTPGADWTSATITVGTVTTGAPGSSATVTNSGTSSAAVLNFSIPQWATGTPGADGDDGAAATITVGTTTTGAAGTSASVTNSGTSSAAVLNFTIPKGDKWDTGAKGADWRNWVDGQDGADWNGIASITSSKAWKITTVTITETNGDSESFQISDWADGEWSWDVIWPSSSTNGDIVLFDGTTGKLIKDSGKTLNDLGSSWGNITGTLSNQTDLATALARKQIIYANCTTPFNTRDKECTTASGNYSPVAWDVIAIVFTQWCGVWSPRFSFDWGNQLISCTVGTWPANAATLWLGMDKVAWLFVYDGTTLRTFPIQNTTYSAGTGISISSNTITNTWVTSVNSNTGAVTVNDVKTWSTAPTAAEGVVWYDTTNDVLKVYDGSNWNEVWAGTWDVVWPSSSVDGHLAVFDGATGKLLKDWGAIPTWVPSGWTDGQVLSKVSGSVAWAAPSGWDVVVSSQSWNILTTWMAIRCGTETDYSNLGSYSNNTLYLTIE